MHTAPYPQLNKKIVGNVTARLALQLAETKCFYLPMTILEKRVAAANLVPEYLPLDEYPNEGMDLIYRFLNDGVERTICEQPDPQDLQNPQNQQNKKDTAGQFLTKHAIHCHLHTDYNMIQSIREWDVTNLQKTFDHGIEGLTFLDNLAMELGERPIARKLSDDREIMVSKQHALTDISGIGKFMDMLYRNNLMSPDINYLAAYKHLRYQSQVAMKIDDVNPN